MLIAELPFHERPAIELLHLENPGIVDTTYAGFGWSRVERLWLSDARGERSLDDVLVLAIHSADDGEALADDIELEFELAPGDSVLVLASTFLARWLPQLPRASQIALAMCNPHRATLPPIGDVPLHYARGDVDSWLDVDDHGSRIRLAAPEWCRVGT